MKFELQHIVIIALLLLILYFVSTGRRISRMGADLSTTQGSMASAGPSSIFDLDYKLGCVAGGFNPDSSFYSKSLTPGGFCGDNDWVRNQQRDFTINEGIGGSLLTK
jgi:hypothetical protein